MIREAIAHVVVQLDKIGEDDVPGRLQQADMPGSGDDIGSLIVGDGIGEQDLVALAQLDMALGDNEPEILVVLHLVGGKDHRRLLAGPRLVRRGGRQGCRCDERAKVQGNGEAHPA